MTDEHLSHGVRALFDCRPAAIVEKLGLRKPIFRATAAYGHFGRKGEGFLWEATDRAHALREWAGQ